MFERPPLGVTPCFWCASSINCDEGQHCVMLVRESWRDFNGPHPGIAYIMRVVYDSVTGDELAAYPDPAGLDALDGHALKTNPVRRAAYMHHGCWLAWDVTRVSTQTGT